MTKTEEKYIFQHNKNEIVDLSVDDKNTLTELLTTITRSKGFATLFDLLKNRAVNTALADGADRISSDRFKGYWDGICEVEDFIKNTASLTKEVKTQ